MCLECEETGKCNIINWVEDIHREGLYKGQSVYTFKKFGLGGGGTHL